MNLNKKQKGAAYRGVSGKIDGYSFLGYWGYLKIAYIKDVLKTKYIFSYTETFIIIICLYLLVGF